MVTGRGPGETTGLLEATVGRAVAPWNCHYHPRPPVQTYRGALPRGHCCRRVRQQLHALAQQEGVTLFMLLLAAFQVLLGPLYGSAGYCGAAPRLPTAPDEEIQGLIGFFTNTLVVRSDLSDNPSFMDLLKRVRSDSIGRPILIRMCLSRSGGERCNLSAICDDRRSSR